jgi:hypothetical protein
MLSLITVLTWPAWHSAALAIGFSILVNALDPLLDLDAEPPVGAENENDEDRAATGSV